MRLRLPEKQTPGAGLRFVLLALARQARHDVERVADHPEARVHGLRTGMKKYRSLLRLAAGAVKKRPMRALRERIRTLKDGLAGSRDDVVIFKTVRAALGSTATERFGLRSPHEESGIEPPETLVLTAAELVVLTEKLDLDALDADRLERGWKKSVKKAREGMKLAGRSGDAHEFHSWRKHVKDVWYQSTALAGLEKTIEAMGKPTRTLSEMLGKEHDLTIVLLTVENLTGPDREVLDKMRRELREEALAYAKKILRS